MSSNTPNSFVFAIIMCVVCGFLLTAAAVGLKDRQDQNVRVDQQKNILKALGLLPDKKIGNDAIQTLFDDRVGHVWMTETGDIVPSFQTGARELYIIGTPSSIQTYAIPFKAYGLWSWIKGYIALKGDGKTISGLTVYSHGETPGLGGECEKPWFQNQFVGKKIVDLSGKFTSIGVVKGKVEDLISKKDQNRYVDGMSGATITGKGMEKYLKMELLNYEPLSQKLRSRDQ
jgi:Na+-transporting NADH:ubiquinone oxidoreductase subunit C